MVVGPGDGLEDVGTVARARNRQQQIAGRRQVFQLLEEDAVVTLVVGPGHDAGGVVGQAEDAEPLLVLEVAQGAFRQIFAEVRGIRPGAAVADDEDEPARAIGRLDQFGHLLNLGRVEPTDFLVDPIKIRLDAQRRAEQGRPPFSNTACIQQRPFASDSDCSVSERRFLALLRTDLRKRLEDERNERFNAEGGIGKIDNLGGGLREHQVDRRQLLAGQGVAAGGKSVRTATIGK